ncbi:hypothetical protein WA026_020464 [Henosepilachna vigintioctopunctata]|uniref:Uncharacterized protein n=1 Tax=Henosepilachna vigintioctopunctata TaxID=420089 RepID=A0AAW1VHY7_9CUCU
MGITLAIFNFVGKPPLSKHKFTTLHNVSENTRNRSAFIPYISVVCFALI